MNHPMRLRAWLAAWAVVSVICSSSLAQQGPPADGPGSYRQLAPGVLKTVDPARRLAETFSRHDVVELLAFDPKFDWARDEPFRHDIWTLELKFKPVRMIWVDVPQPSGNMQKQLIWYMVYSVTNRKIEEKTVDEKTLQSFEKAQAQAVAVGGNQGVKALPQYGWMHPVQSAAGTCQIQFLNKPIRFIPEFVLESPEFDKPYERPDRVIPVAVARIRQREDPNREFHTTVEICNRMIQPGETVWGVVTWGEINPQIDRFSIYVQGLTNAYLWEDTPGAYKTDSRIGTGRTLVRKTLKLTFWRPGDKRDRDERGIRYGVPEEVDYEWVYRYKTRFGEWVYLDKDKDGKWIHLHRHDWVWRYKDDEDGRWIYAYKDNDGDWVFWYRDYGDSFWRTTAKDANGRLIFLYQDRDDGWVYVYKDKGTWLKLPGGSVFEKTVPPSKRRFPLS